MKNLLLILIAGFLIIFVNDIYAVGTDQSQVEEQVNGGVIYIERSGDVSDLMDALVSLYKKEHPAQRFIISSRQGEAGSGGIRVFSDNGLRSNDGAVPGRITIANDIVVPVMHVNNPLASLLETRGLTDNDFAELLVDYPSWNSIIAESNGVSGEVYITDDRHLIDLVAGYAGITASQVKATRIPLGGNIISSVGENSSSIGFCRLTDVLDAEGTGFDKSIKIIPVDKNRNGRIDRFEQIYATPVDMVRGVWVGKYPGRLSSKIYAAPVSGSYDEASAGFLAWVLNEGQEKLASIGYSNILTREVTAGMNALNPFPLADSPASVPVGRGVWIPIISLVIFLLVIYLVAGVIRRKKERLQSEDITLTPALNSGSIKAPAGLFYDKTHTWAFMEQDGMVKVGINDFLQHVTGPLSQIKMRAPEETIRKGEKILSIVHEGKQLQIGSPVTGVIKRCNQAISTDPSSINTDPYSDGWIYQVEPSNWLRETKFMFMATGFAEWLDEEFVRLKDFLAASANSNEVVYNHIVMQDGGELTDNVLATMEPKVWEDFQTKFLDVSR